MAVRPPRRAIALAVVSALLLAVAGCCAAAAAEAEAGAAADTAAGAVPSTRGQPEFESSAAALRATADQDAFARVRFAEARHNAAFIGSAMSAMGGAMGMPGTGLRGRGRGRGRAGMYMGPDEFDQSWWLPPPPVGPDQFLGGYSSHVPPRHAGAFGGMPNGGYGAAHHFWGGPSYHYPLNVPWWRGQNFASRPQQFSSPAQPYTTPRDSFGLAYGGTFPMASPYYYTPPPLQGDWNLPKNPPPPPGGTDPAP